LVFVVANSVSEYIAAVEVRMGAIGQCAIGVDGDRAVGALADSSDGKRVVVYVSVVRQHINRCYRRVLLGCCSVTIGHWRVVDWADRDI